MKSNPGISKLFIGLYLIIIAFIRLPAQISTGSTSGSATQNFAGLGVLLNPTWTNNSSIPNWYAQRTTSFTTCTPSNGSASSGDLYNYGTTNAADRSLGSIGSTTAGSFAWGVLLRNNGVANNRTSITVSFTGEQWRYGGGGSQTVSFYYKRSSLSISNLQPNSSASWTAVSALNFVSPISTLGARSLDGNLAANRVLISITITLSPALADGEYVMLKWDDPDQLGADSGFSIDDVTISWTAANNLPIGLSKFSGNSYHNQTNLQWSTASEINNDYFEIQSAGSEYGFRSIGTMNGALHSLVKKDYSFTDFSPYPGVNYYRLKQVDLDGSFTYSKTISIFFNPENSVQIFPNPASNELKMIFNINDVGQSNTFQYEIRIYDYLGRFIKSWKTDRSIKETSLDISEIPIGNYLLQLQDAQQVHSYTFMKK